MSAQNLKPYIISTMPYIYHSAGIRALHKLGALLNRTGYEAWSVLDYAGARRPQSGESLSGPGYAGQRQPYADDVRPLIDNGITIYPDCVMGNHFDAPRVVHYALCYPGFCGGDTEYSVDRPCFVYNSIFEPFVKRCDGILYIDVIDHDWFNSVGANRRDGNCHYAGKRPGPFVGIDPAQLGTEINRDRAPISRQDMARLFRRSKVLYCRDEPSMVLHEARLCGCVAYMVDPLPGAAERTRELFGPAGLAWDAESLQIALDNVGDFTEQYFERSGNIYEQLKNFVEVTQKAYAE